MPYIGRNHVAGDHTSNFKVLDDISSYTATFNGSLATIISTADNTIRIPEHRFIQGQRVTYSNGGGGNIGGLTNGTAYFVTFDTANTFKLATSLANANNNTNVNLSSVGSGSSHTLTAAFDGTNTKFKLTHNGGESGRLNNATQLQIAINNVLQRPNIDPNNFTEGFAVERGNKIVFQTAPTSNDVFWGSIIANTLETFDISDNKVENFTGDGSTTEFNLSRIPPNNGSIVVTINGVLQHSSDATTARAYSLSSQLLIFTSAPANGDEIQVRHIGFAGASTGQVSGFYGRTGNVVLGASDHITTGDITPRNINASGIVTASSFSGGFSGNIVGTSATFTGNLSVGGVLTYEDVTNIDSVGIITAAKDIHVGAGVSAVGVGTFGSLDIVGDIDLPDSSKLKLGTGDDFEMFFSGTNSIFNHTPTGVAGGALFIQSNNLILRSYNPNNQYLTATYNDGTRIYHNNLLRIQTLSDGIQITNTTGGSNPTKLRVNANEGQNAELHLIADQGDDNNDNWKISSDGSTNDLNFQNYNGSAWETGISIAANGAVELYHDNTKRLETTSTGIKAYGNDHLFTTESTGDCRIILQSDSDNNAENDNSAVVFRQDGSADIGAIGVNLTNSTSIPLSQELFVAASSGESAIILATGFSNGYNNAVERVRINNAGVTTFTENVFFNKDLDVDGHTNLDNVSISGVSTATGGSVFGLIQAGVGALNATIQKTNNTELNLQYNKPGNLELCQGGGLVRVHNNFNVVGLSTLTGGARLGQLMVGYGAYNITVQPITGNNTLHLNYDNGTQVRIGEGQTRSDLIVKGDIEPKTDSAFDLGTNTVRWRNVYADTLYGDGSNLGGINTDLVSDTSPQLGADLDCNQKGILLQDRNSGNQGAIKWGDNGEMWMFHAGGDNTNRIYSSGKEWAIWSGASNDHACLKVTASDTDPAIELYYNNSKKLETTNTGISVTGKVGIGTDNPADALVVKNSEPTIRLVNTSTPNAGNSGRIRFSEYDTDYQGAFIHYNGALNKFHLGTHSSMGTSVANDVNIMTIDRDSGITTFRNNVQFYGNVIKLPTNTSNPGSVIAGDCYFNTAQNAFKIYDGTDWGSVVFAAKGTQQNPATSPSDLAATGALAQYYFSPDGGTAFQQYACGALSNLGTIPSGGPSWVGNISSLVIIHKAQVGTTASMIMSRANYLKFIEESDNRTNNTNYIYWAVFDNGTLWGITRTRWTGITYSTWASAHGSQGVDNSTLNGTPVWDVWKTGSGTAGGNISSGSYTVSNDNNLVRAVLPGDPHQGSANNRGLHYKRTGSGEHYPWFDGNGNVTDNGYFYPSSSYYMATDSRYQHYLFLSDT